MKTTEIEKLYVHRAIALDENSVVGSVDACEQGTLLISICYILQSQFTSNENSGNDENSTSSG